MKTIITYTLYFSRENNYLPFLAKSTLIFKGWKLVHSNETTILPKYDWELKEMYKDFRSFQHEEADKSEITYSCLECCKTMIIRKTWEG